MLSIVPQPQVTAPVADATGRPGPTTAGEGRVTQDVPSDVTKPATIIVAGAPQVGKSSLVNAVLGGPPLATVGGTALVTIPRPADRSGDRTAVPAVAPGARPAGAHVGGSTGATPVARPVTSAFLTFRYGETPAAYAYVPGHKGPRPMSLDELHDGDSAALMRGGSGRAPRRVDVRHPSPVLRHVRIVDTPGSGGFDPAYTEIVLDALAQGGALLFVTEAAVALQPAQLDFLAQVERLGAPVTFVLTKIDLYPQWPAVLAADQTLVHDHTPGLATAPWYAVSALQGKAELPPAAIEEAARGLAGLGLAALRQALVTPPPGEPDAPAEPATAAPPPSARPAPRVVAQATDSHWMHELDRLVRVRGTQLGRRLAIDLATVHVTCVQDTSREHGCQRLAHVFDRELHALSLRATRAVDETADAIIGQVFGLILDGPPDATALARIRRSVRRAVEDAVDAPEWDRILLVTATSGIAVTAGRGASAGLAAVPPHALDQAVLPPIGIALSAGCYAMWRPGNDRKECRGWLQLAIRALEVGMDKELTRRFEDLRQGIAAVAADTIDHGVLLA